MVFIIVFVLLLIPFHIGLWKMFEKAGRKGWESVIPIYDLYVIQKITGKPVYWIIACLFPGINLIVFAAMLINLYKSFGKTTTKEHLLGLFFYYYFTPKWAFDPNVKYIPVDKLPVRPKSVAKEWLEAGLFAVVAATIIKTYTFEAYKIPSSSMEGTLLTGDFLFVSKLNYGPKIPSLPLTFPFTHNSFRDIPIPGMPNVKSYLEWVELPYLRIPGWQKIKNDDIVVFNFPEGDTIVNTAEAEAFSYYNMVLDEASEQYKNNGFQGNPNYYIDQTRELYNKNLPIAYRPVDKRSNYIKRCIGIPGNVIEIKDGDLFVDGKKQKEIEEKQFKYFVEGANVIPKAKLLKMGVTDEDQRQSPRDIRPHGKDGLFLTLTAKQAEEVKKMAGVISVTKNITPRAALQINTVFPHSVHYDWSADNFGPLKVPSKGETVQLDTINIAIYKRIISVYEKHKLEIKGDKIFIDDAEAKSYTFEMNYYFMMGDNRHGSLDSRFWGFVPDDHIVGKASMVWFSSGEDGIRWKRFFNLVN